MANILANSIKNKDHLKVFDDMAALRFADIDISVLIPNLFDTVPVEALPYLAKQYNLLGYNGWRFADTEQKQRDLLKGWAIMKGLKGTLFSLKEALKFVGFDNADIRIDPYDFYPNGAFQCNGHFTCGGNNPFNFDILIHSSDYPNVTAQNVIDIIAVIKEFKSARDLLISLCVDDGDKAEVATTTDALHIVVTDGITNPVYDI